MSLSPEELRQKNREALEKRKAIEALWRKGVVKWKLDKNQEVMHEFATKHEHKVVVIACSRRLGKSYFLSLLAVETCMQKPDQIVKFVAPKVKDIKRIISPLIKEITNDCPKELRPKYNTLDHTFRFSNGSEIQLAGTDNGHADSIRGTQAHLCIIDEAGFCDDLSYVVNSVLMPTTTTTGGKIIMASTPSRSPDHDFMEFWDRAEADGRCIVRTVYDNPRLGEEQINEIADALGGKDSVDFRREYLVERIIDEESAVVPEFNEELRKKIIRIEQMPPHFDSYVSMDIGGNDLTVVLFAYWDFIRAKLVIQDEYVAQGQVLTDVIANTIKFKEQYLWGGKPPHLRIADNNNIILLNDLAVKHQLNFVPTLKDNKEAALNNMRLLLKSESIIIDPKCVTLISHLKGAIWSKNKRTYARSSDKGHYDAVDALVYLCRNVNMSKNPYPDNYNITGKGDIFYSPTIKQESNSSNFETKMTELFKIKKPNRFGRF